MSACGVDGVETMRRGVEKGNRVGLVEATETGTGAASRENVTALRMRRGEPGGDKSLSGSGDLVLSLL